MDRLHRAAGFLRQHIQPGDLAIIAAVAALALLAATLTGQLGGASQQPDQLRVLHLSEPPGQQTVLRVSLPTENTYTVRGDEGELVVEIDGYRARVKTAECPRLICVRTGWLHNPGDRSLCVPNQLVVELLGDDDEELDEILR